MPGLRNGTKSIHPGYLRDCAVESLGSGEAQVLCLLRIYPGLGLAPPMWSRAKWGLGRHGYEIQELSKPDVSKPVPCEGAVLAVEKSLRFILKGDVRQARWQTVTFPGLQHKPQGVHLRRRTGVTECSVGRSFLGAASFAKRSMGLSGLVWRKPVALYCSQ